MTEDKYRKIKEELRKAYWTEDYHLELAKLSNEEAKEIVEEMDDDDIEFRVNVRKYQEAYISDYLEYLWEISKTAYWKHIKTTLNPKVGFLWSDNMSYVDIMCSNPMPDDVFETILDFAAACSEENQLDLGIIGNIIKIQSESFNRLADVNKYISLVKDDKQVAVSKRLKEMLDGTISF